MRTERVDRRRLCLLPSQAITGGKTCQVGLRYFTEAVQKPAVRAGIATGAVEAFEAARVAKASLCSSSYTVWAEPSPSTGGDPGGNPGWGSLSPDSRD